MTTPDPPAPSLTPEEREAAWEARWREDMRACARTLGEPDDYSATSSGRDTIGGACRLFTGERPEPGKLDQSAPQLGQGSSWRAGWLPTECDIPSGMSNVSPQSQR